MAEQPEQQQRPADAQKRAAAIAAALALGVAAGAAGAAAVAAPVLTAGVLAALTRLFLRWGYRRDTVRYALRITTRVVRTTSPARVGAGPAELANARAEHTFAAWFLERSTARVEAAYTAGAEPGAPEQAEARFLEQHLDAQQKRREAARRVDVEARKPGQVTDDGDAGEGPRIILKWRAHPDDKTTPECAAADGAWFYADTPPIIGFPGMPHGGTCRCWPANAGSLAEVARGRHVNEAVRGIISTTDHPTAHPGAGRKRDDERQTV